MEVDADLHDQAIHHIKAIEGIARRLKGTTAALIINEAHEAIEKLYAEIREE